MKRIFKIVLIGVCAGFIMLSIQIGFGINSDVFIKTYWKLAPVIIIGAVLINVCYNLFYYNKLRKAIVLLGEDKPQEYIDCIEMLLKTAKGKSLRNILMVNLAAGYIEAKKFDEGIVILEELNHRQLKGSGVIVVQQINLCLAYFETAQYDKVVELYNNNQSLFCKFKNDKGYGGYIALLDAIVLIINKKYADAEALLADVRNNRKKTLPIFHF